MKTTLLAASVCSLAVPLAVACVSRPPGGGTAATAPSDGSATLASFVEGDLETRFDALAPRGRLETAPWPSGYWPDSLGGIARRWSRDEVSESVYYATPKSTDVKAWPRERIAALSPAEKWDLFRGRYDFPTLEAVRARSGFLVPDWAGLCDGVALASTVFPEPAGVTVRNPDGLEIPFASSDVKALLAWHVQNAEGREAVRYGSRCDANEPRTPPRECDDVSAADFHLALANRIGRDRKPFMADLTWDALVWNHVLFDYETRVRERGAPSAFPELSDKARATGAKEIVRVSTRVLANTFQVREHWQPGEPERKEDEFHYQYWLFLDGAGRIVGSHWRSYERPDFLWRPTRTPELGDPALRTLLAASTAGAMNAANGANAANAAK